MRIAVFGATGMAGRPIVAEGLTRGHAVVAVSRHPGTLPWSDRLEIQHCDVRGSMVVGTILADCDVAVLAVRPDPGDEHGSAAWTAGFLDAAARTATRVIVVGGAAALRSPNDPDLLVADDPMYVPAQWSAFARASLDQFRICRVHLHAEVTYLSPSAVFEPGPRTGRYRRGCETLLTDTDGISRIGAGDLAVAVLDEIEVPAGEWHFTVADVSRGRDSVDQAVALSA